MMAAACLLPSVPGTRVKSFAPSEHATPVNALSRQSPHATACVEQQSPLVMLADATTRKLQMDQASHR